MALEMKRFTASGGRILGILLAVRGYSGFVIALAFQALEPIDHDRRNAFLAAEPMLPMNTSTDGHPPGADYEKETQIALGHKAARLPMSMEVCVATVWVLMVVAMPMVSIRMSGQNVTRTVIITTATMLVSFLGGIWLFTNILLFQSSHFEGNRSLTLVECVYVMAQVLTTVGYGDITPARPRAQVFVALYVLCTLLLIANTVSEVANKCADQLWRVQEEGVEKAANSVRKLVSSTSFELPATGTLEFDQFELRNILRNKVPPLPWKAFHQKLAGWLFFVCLGIAFYTNYPGEEKTMWQSVYFSIITLSTVGFGAFTALTPGGKAFGAFWMLFGSLSLLGLVGAFTEMMCVLRSHEKWRIQKENVDEDELFRELPDELDLQAFMEFSVEYSSLVKKEELQQILGTYEELRKQSGRRSISRDQALALYER